MMKRFFALLLALLLLTACGKEQQRPAPLYPQEASFSEGYINMKLYLPEDWQWSVIEPDPDDPTAAYGLQFGPADRPDAYELVHEPQMQMFCGTGVHVQTVTLPNGEEIAVAAEFRMESGFVWISLNNRYCGNYIFYSSLGALDWREHEQTLYQIISDARIGEGYISGFEATERAIRAMGKKLGEEKPSIAFWQEPDRWVVPCTAADGTDYRVSISPKGKILEITEE